jgi:hypothetical protein
MKITTVSRLFQRLQHHCVEAVLAFYHKVESRIPEDVVLVSKGLRIGRVGEEGIGLLARLQLQMLPI